MSHGVVIVSRCVVLAEEIGQGERLCVVDVVHQGRGGIVDASVDQSPENALMVVQVAAMRAG